jgi:hypothetical protein
MSSFISSPYKPACFGTRFAEASMASSARVVPLNAASDSGALMAAGSAERKFSCHH